MHLFSDKMHLWAHFVGLVATWAVLGSVRTIFLLTVGSHYAEKLGFVILTPLSTEVVFCRYWQGRMTHSCPTSDAKSVGMATSYLDGPSRSKVWAVIARMLCRSYGNCRAAAQTQVSSNVKVCLSGKSYDLIF